MSLKSNSFLFEWCKGIDHPETEQIIKDEVLKTLIINGLKKYFWSILTLT